MCSYSDRVSSCGHYRRTCTAPCSTAKRNKQVCTSGNTISASTTGSLCYLYGCDQQPNLKREGPGARINGGFHSSDVDFD
ncbi:unnamed protein product [Periconia digitata]|uniref:Uncharacterized protein n=1 Tax=Periconia digitata TaxID=1303443 RepID=A0A9W4XVG9_9PLEO|nr:unnamed protein product [Periconia digitata]